MLAPTTKRTRAYYASKKRGSPFRGALVSTLQQLAICPRSFYAESHSSRAFAFSKSARFSRSIVCFLSSVTCARPYAERLL